MTNQGITVREEVSPEQFDQNITRFWRSVNVSNPTDCWQWTGGINHYGYGSFRIGSRTNGTRRLMTAHRFMALMVLGRLPTGIALTFDHLCRNRACVNPTHMQLVTRGENANRGIGAPAQFRRRMSCNYGHPFTLQNTSKRSNGGRVCKTCERIRGKLRYASQKEHNG